MFILIGNALNIFFSVVIIEYCVRLMEISCALCVTSLFRFYRYTCFFSKKAERFHPAFSGIKKKQNWIYIFQVNFAAEIA